MRRFGPPDCPRAAELSAGLTKHDCPARALTIESAGTHGFGDCGARLALTIWQSGQTGDPPLRVASRIILAALIGLFYAVPAYAAVGAPLPEPNAITLLSLGLAGLIIGRRAGSKGKRD